MAISRRGALGILTSVVGALFLARCRTPEPSSVESHHHNPYHPYGGGHTPYNPYGGGWNPHNPYEPYGGGWNPYNPYEPYGGGWNPHNPYEPYGGGWNPYNPYGVDRNQMFRSRADGTLDRAVASAAQSRRGLALSMLERLTDVIG